MMRADTEEPAEVVAKGMMIPFSKPLSATAGCNEDVGCSQDVMVDAGIAVVNVKFCP